MAEKGKRGLGSDGSNPRPRQKPLIVVFNFDDLMSPNDRAAHTTEGNSTIDPTSLESAPASQNLGRNIHSWDLNELPPQEEEILGPIQPHGGDNNSEQMENGRRNSENLNNPVVENPVRNMVTGYPHSSATLPGQIPIWEEGIQERSGVPERYQRGLFMEPIDLYGGTRPRRTD